MDAITTIANMRGTSEERVANDMTYRQLHHIAGVFVRDRMFVVTSLVQVFGGMAKRSSEKHAAEKQQAQNPKGGKLPAWFRPRGKVAAVVSTDGPLEHLRDVAAGRVFPGVPRPVGGSTRPPARTKRKK